MSDRDSFIDEVTDEVRRDRLFGLMRRWGWLGILLVVLIVAGAAVNEWRQSQARAQAQARGDAVVAALLADGSARRAQALQGVEADGPGAAVLAMLSAAEVDDPQARAAAIDRLEGVAADPALDQIWSHLAALKVATLRADTMTPDELLQRLEPLAAPGAPYRPLAEEQIALARVRAGDAEAAISMFTDLLDDNDAPQGLRARARQMIVALGGALEAS